MNASWVHVRISGLSRGWIRRSSLEMPSAFAAGVKDENPSVAANPEHFQVKNEEIASFPGTWEPLRGKTVKILTVQNANANPADTNSRAKLEFAKSLFDREYAELLASPNHGGWRSADFRYRRWRNGCGDAADSSAMEGRHFIRPSLLAPLLLRSPRNIHFADWAVDEGIEGCDR